MTEKETFEFTYSAPQQDEIRQIREKYLPKEMTGLEQLRALDARVTKRGLAVSITHGILFTLLLGTGMCCCMIWPKALFLPGILIGCIGMAGTAATWPIYNHIVRRERARIAPEILRLSEELILGNN